MGYSRRRDHGGPFDFIVDAEADLATIVGPLVGQFALALAEGSIWYHTGTVWTEISGGAAIPATVGGVFKSPTAADDVLVWSAPFDCTVTAVTAWQDADTGSEINAFTGSLASPTLFLAADYAIMAADTAEDAGTVQNTAITTGDKVYVRLASVSGTPDEIGVQVSFLRG